MHKAPTSNTAHTQGMMAGAGRTLSVAAFIARGLTEKPSSFQDRRRHATMVRAKTQGASAR